MTYGELIRGLNEEYEKKLSEVRVLQSQIDVLSSELADAKEQLNNAYQEKISFDEMLKSMVPVKVYQHKNRHNTTVKFWNGDCVTVHLIDGDEDCLETAIAFALIKKLYPRKLIKNLVKDAEIIENEVKECKKR